MKPVRKVAMPVAGVGTRFLPVLCHALGRADIGAEVRAGVEALPRESRALT